MADIDGTLMNMYMPGLHWQTTGCFCTWQAVILMRKQAVWALGLTNTHGINIHIFKLQCLQQDVKPQRHETITWLT